MHVYIHIYVYICIYAYIEGGCRWGDWCFCVRVCIFVCVCVMIYIYSKGSMCVRIFVYMKLFFLYTCVFIRIYRQIVSGKYEVCALGGFIIPLLSRASLIAFRPVCVGALVLEIERKRVLVRLFICEYVHNGYMYLFMYTDVYKYM